MRIFSGIQPTGRKHLGNYIGAITQYVAGQDRSLWSVDYGAFTTTGMGVWTQLPVPNGDASSGRFYIVAHRLPFGSHLLFHSDSNVVRVCSGSRRWRKRLP